MEDTKKTKPCPYAGKGCKCEGCADCKRNAEKERAVYKLEDNPEDV
jgi:hypothetical protein